MFSLELPEEVTKIGNAAFSYCYCIRNVAFPAKVVFGDIIFGGQGEFKWNEYDLFSCLV